MKDAHKFVKTYKFAGVARHKTIMDNAWKIRFGKDAHRVRLLERLGFEQDMIELPYAMSKEQAIDHLVSIDFANGESEVLAVLATAGARYSVKPANTSKPKSKPKSTATTAITAAEVKQQLEDLEDAPF